MSKKAHYCRSLRDDNDDSDDDEDNNDDDDDGRTLDGNENRTWGVYHRHRDEVLNAETIILDQLSDYLRHGDGRSTITITGDLKKRESFNITKKLRVTPL